MTAAKLSGLPARATQSCVAPTARCSATSSTAPASPAPSRSHGFAIAGARCLVVGAGGAGAAIAAALATAGASTVRLHDTRSAHAEALAAQLRSHFPRTDIHAGAAALAGFGLVVNATPLGMDADDPLPIDVTQITPEMVIAEIVMKREITPMLEAARARGCRIVLGREMLREQMPLYLDFFGLTAATTCRVRTDARCADAHREHSTWPKRS